GDNTSRIQAAIDTVAQRTPDASGLRGAVVLAAGRFDVAGTLNITASGVVLRGSGSGSSGTLLNLTGSPHPLLSIKGSGTPQTVGSSATITDGFLPSGALSFHVNSSSGFAVGDTILVSRPVTADWVHFMSMDDLVRNGAPQTWLAAGSSISSD